MAEVEVTDGLKISSKICQSSTCDELAFVETTGAYSVLNQNGWGSPNEDTTDATSATLLITTPGGNEYTIDLFATGDFPTTDTSLEYVIQPTDIGLSAGSKIPDGIYTFLYTVETPSETLTSLVYQALYCQVQCCVYSMFKDLNVNCDSCHDKKTKAIDAYLLLKGLIYSANCGNSTYFNSQLTTLQKLCLGSNCKNCK